MEPRKILLLVVALLIAGGTAYLARSTMQAQEPQKQQEKVVAKPAVPEILVAARDMPAGTLLKDVDLKWQPLLEDTAPKEGEIVKGKAKLKDFVSGVVRKGIRKDMPITSERVVPKGDEGFLAAVLTPGMRAVSVTVTPVSSLGGLLFPGDHVDVIVTHQLDRKNEATPGGHRISETFLKDVRVLALDQRADDQTVEPKLAQVATLEVTPKQAETLALISSFGTLSLALRAQEPETNPNAPPSLSETALQKPSMTWDSDVSQVLEKPANRHAITQRVQIMRGKETKETIFDMQQ